MRFLLILLKPYLFWILLSVMIYLFRGQLFYLFGLYQSRRSHLHYLKDQTYNQLNAKARFELGLHQLRWGNFNLAISFFNEAVSIDPEDANYHYHLGTAYLKSKKAAPALAAFQKCLALKPDFLFGQVYLRIGDSYLLQRDYPSAGNSYQQMLEINPYEGEALYKIGLCKYHQGHKKEAAEYLSQTITNIKALPDFRFKKDRIWLYKALWLKLFLI